MNSKPSGQGFQIADQRFAGPLPVFDKDQVQLENKENPRGDPRSLLAHSFSMGNSSSPTIAGRNKRKNFSPKYTSASASTKHSITKDRSPPETIDHKLNECSPQGDDSEAPASTLPKSPHYNESAMQTKPPSWNQILNDYSQLNKALKLAACKQISNTDGSVSSRSASARVDEWVTNFCSSQSTVSAFRDLLKVYSCQQTGYCSVLQDNNSDDGHSIPMQTTSVPSKSHDNSMQITTINGFFSRKRGRPPKNRFVEIYKHAQQSPEAIFTSFKLEKQSNKKDCGRLQQINAAQVRELGTEFVCDNGPQARSPQHFIELSDVPLVQSPIKAIQCSTIKADDYSGLSVKSSSIDIQNDCQHIHSPDISFKTIEQDLLRGYLERRHTNANFTDKLNKQFKPCDRNIGPDWRNMECRQRKAHPDLQCCQCDCQISTVDIETHVCNNLRHVSSTLSSYSRIAEESKLMSPELTTDRSTIVLNKSPPKDLTVVSHSTSNATELARKTNKIKRKVNLFPKQRLLKNQKVSVVRAAGTYFPENTHELNGIAPLELQSKRLTSLRAVKHTTVQTIPNLKQTFYLAPYNEVKRKSNQYCNICEQSFLDPAGSKSSFEAHSSAVAIRYVTENGNVLQSASGEISSTCLSYEDQPQDLSLSLSSPSLASKDISKPQLPDSIAYSYSPEVGQLNNVSAPNHMCNMSMQNLHLVNLAALYQQAPSLFPFLNKVVASTQQHQTQVNRVPTPAQSDIAADIPTSPTSTQLSLLDQLLMIGATEKEENSTITTSLPLRTKKVLKRKFSGNNEDQNAFAKILSSISMKQFAAPKLKGRNAIEERLSVSRNDHGGQHFKIKVEKIPSGYLKFRFNEDCCFPKCGYRNHQSHFHCDRNDCHYSFCDKSRFVQHTARHERLDKLMGSDFRQYRANMNCGYDNCSHFKNLGSRNKSSHFHCLKCDFICSDTNKVVAHRRQHSKMEYIRMAGFRQVTSTEKCHSTAKTYLPIDRHKDKTSYADECSYSQKQKHYHCLVCDVSVLSRAQLAAHKHKV